MRQYIVDAFTDKVFGGNQAAVCVLDEWIPDSLMIKIAKENNFSETAFTVKKGDAYELRWFTPGGEISLCGHATLGTSYVLFRFYEKDSKKIVFNTMSGELIVEKEGDRMVMDFPVYKLNDVQITKEMEEALGARIIEAYKDRDLLFVLESEDVVKNLKPDQLKLEKFDCVCIGVTAKGSESDSVSRVFAPRCGVPEDPVTGSMHCMIVPYWVNKLGKNEIVAKQASERGGMLYCKLEGDRVKIAGKAVLFSVSDILDDYPDKESL